MNIEVNETGGTSVILDSGDDLDDVPPSHQALLTPILRTVFADPVKHFRAIAQRSPFPAMSAWIEALLEENNWQLMLHQGRPEHWTEADFCWWSENVRSAGITPSDGRSFPHLPRALQSHYQLLHKVRWMYFGRSGCLYDPTKHVPLTEFSYSYENAPADPAKTFAFSWSSCGDMLIYTQDGRAGWMWHETGQIRLLGKLEDLIDWVYAELLANRCPDFNDLWNWKAV